jgi:transposase
MVAIALRDDYSASQVRRLAAVAKDGAQARRLLSIAAVYDGMSRTDAAMIGGMDRQTLRDWVHRFNEAGPEGLLNRKSSGAPSKLNPDQRRALAAIVEQGPIPAIHEVVRWRLLDLKQWIWDEFAIELDQSTVSRELKALGFVKMTARPQHQAQNEYVLDDFKKVSPPHWEKSSPACRRARP